MKRSSQVALLLMGTTAVGSTAYTLMPKENCSIDRPAIVTPGTPPAIECAPRSNSSSSSGSYRSSGSSSGQSLFDRDSSSSNRSAGSGSSTDSGGHVTRGGFGSFAHSFTSHFSGGG